jgi:glycosyltransferase involved in cell wall biosynthesis
MKICMIGNYKSYSGAFEVFRTIARYAKRSGHTVAYVHHNERAGEVCPDLSMFDEVISCPNDGRPRDEFAAELASIANRFDVIHTSLLPQDWRFAFKAKCTRPMVETYHSADGWKWCWRQFKWRAMSGKEKPANVTVAVSNGLRQAIADDMQTVPATEGADIRRIMNGVEIPDTIAEGGPYVTYAGRISADKGLDVWMAVAEQLHRRIPSAKFQWVGALSPQYDDFSFRCLQAACPWLEVVGFQEDVAPYYRRSKVLLLTSPSEGLPMILIEAAAHGIPSVAFNTGDVKETPALIATDANHAADLVSWIFNFPQNAERLRELARERFSAEAMAREYLSVYSEVAGR